ncbi:hypothetical protein FRC08_012785 [Ceratobasidium sp. 394]|nr:hypothetical protein FRC08_012785 [Ceratobasidium sp. 394]KAG9083297.1 hypothetical protein FS749_006147 [Ceratobasidium sp. UAMH 11750]
MICHRLFALIAAAAVAVALPNNATSVPRACGTHLSDSAIVAAEAHFAAHKLSPRTDGGAYNQTIPVYWHVIQAGTNLTDGSIPESQITDTIDAMNNHFNESGLSFELAGRDYTTNADWFAGVGPNSIQESDMKGQLRQGGANALNVYSVGFTSGTSVGLIGYATYPWDYARRPNNDGVVIRYSVVRGGSTPHFNEGKSVTHEVGHWVGLYHTFQGGCKGTGDFVDDTPPENGPAFGCPTHRDSCPGGGVDPIHNYMDNTDDECMFEFTPGQIGRFKSQLATYRGVGV